MFLRLCWRAPRTVMCVMAARGGALEGVCVGVWGTVAKTLGYGIQAVDRRMWRGEGGRLRTVDDCSGGGCPGSEVQRQAHRGAAGIRGVTMAALNCVYLREEGLPEWRWRFRFRVAMRGGWPAVSELF